LKSKQEKYGAMWICKLKSKIEGGSIIAWICRANNKNEDEIASKQKNDGVVQSCGIVSKQENDRVA
jgi:hypothetical protein